jgi:chromosome segregation ATPase
MNENKKCCDSNEEKHCEGKHEKNCKRTELESQIETLSTELELAKKTIEEQKSTITSYLSTASYYKNELDNQKKDFGSVTSLYENLLEQLYQIKKKHLISSWQNIALLDKKYADNFVDYATLLSEKSVVLNSCSIIL